MNYLETIVDICHANLSAQHRKYVLSRGITDDTIELFQIGTFFSEAIRDKVPIEFLEEKKILFKGKGQKAWSEFDKRVIIPIVDHSGQYVGITGRLTEDSDRAKYCNSNYSKSSILFGLDKAKRDIIAANTAIVVEGNLDVIAAHECGVKNVVAICGTAMSESHLHLLLRYTNRIVLGLDNDDAGAAARSRSLDMIGYYAKNNLIDVSILEMPEGIKDINELMCKIGRDECARFLSSFISTDKAPASHQASWEWTLDE